MRSAVLETVTLLLVLVFVAAVVGPIGYAMEGLPSMFWAIGGTFAWVMIFALAAKASSAKMHAWALIGGWLCGTAWSLGWLIARALEQSVGDAGMHHWGVLPALIVTPFAGIGGGLLAGVAFGERGKRYGAALALSWGVVSGVAPFTVFRDTPTFGIVALCAVVGLTGGIVGLPLGLRLGQFLRPIVFVLHELRPYLTEMAVPFAGFVSGYVALVLLFAGVIGSLWRLAPEVAFSGFPAGPTFVDFAHFSVAAATGGPTAVQANSFIAKLVVSLEAIFAQGWMIAVFAAVGAHLTPRFTRLADQNPAPALADAKQRSQPRVAAGTAKHDSRRGGADTRKKRRKKT